MKGCRRNTQFLIFFWVCFVFKANLLTLLSQLGLAFELWVAVVEVLYFTGVRGGGLPMRAYIVRAATPLHGHIKTKGGLLLDHLYIDTIRMYNVLRFLWWPVVPSNDILLLLWWLYILKGWPGYEKTKPSSEFPLQTNVIETQQKSLENSFFWFDHIIKTSPNWAKLS